MSEYEDILNEIRPFGPYQRRVFILVSMFETPLAWAMLLPIFTSASPSATTGHSSMNISGSVTKEAAMLNDINDSVCLQSGAVYPHVVFNDSFTSIVSEWRLVCDADYIPDLIISLQMVGVLVGALVTGQLADLLGRRKILFAEYLLLLVVWFGSAFVTTWQVYAALRVVIGALVGGTLVVNFVLPLEFVTPSWRTFCGCVGFWAVGLMTLALWAFFLRDWRHLTMATSVSSILLVFSWWFIPESPRWLLNRGDLKEATLIITNMAKFNGRPVPDFSHLRQFVEREQYKKDQQRKYSYCHLFSSWKLTKGSLILIYGWFVSSSVYYGLNFNAKNLSGSRYLNVFLSGLVEIPALVFVVAVNNRLGRRVTTTTLMLTAGVFCFSILVLDLTGHMRDMPKLTLALSLIGKSGISGAWAAVQVFSAETFPTVIRNIGIGACSMAARVGGIVAPQFVYLGREYSAVPFAVFGSLALVCGALMMVMLETVGTPLPDHIDPPPRSDARQPAGGAADELHAMCDVTTNPANENEDEVVPNHSR